MAVSHAQGGALSLGDSVHGLCPHIHLGMVGLLPNTGNVPVPVSSDQRLVSNQHAPDQQNPSDDHDEDAVYCSELTIPDCSPVQTHFTPAQFVTVLSVLEAEAVPGPAHLLAVVLREARWAMSSRCPIYLRTLSLRF
jgi:hypothetical protein